MKKLLILPFIYFTSCASQQSNNDAPIAKVGSDFTKDAALIFQDYQAIKGGDTSMLSSLQKGLDAYAPLVSTVTDVKSVIQQWSDMKGTTIQKIGSLLDSNPQPLDVKVAALAAVASSVANDKAP